MQATWNEHNMSIVPSHKSDYQACHHLSQASDKEVEKHLAQLLEWLQDINSAGISASKRVR